MRGRLRANLRQLRAGLVPMRQRGLSLSGSLLHQLPAALLLRGWRRVAQLLDARLLNRLLNSARLDTSAPQESLVAVFEQYSQTAGRHDPLTHVLALHAEPMRRLMLKHGIDARQYRRAPQRLASALASIGMGPRRYLKDYQQFHDTAHVLLGMALAEGWSWRLEAMDEDAPVMHVGGTSIGSHHTKNLFALYVHLRFLELLDDAPLIRERYAFLTWPLRNSVEAQLRAVPHDPAWQTLPVLEALMQRMSDLNPKA